MRAAAERLKQFPCKAPGCHKNRRGITPYCATHEVRVARYGHPSGKPIAQKDYQEELDEVSTFLTEQANHPAVLAALAWLSKWFKEASEKKAEYGQYIFGRLQGRMITPLAVLTDVGAIWVYSQRHPYRLPDDQRLTFCYARNVARLATFERRTYESGGETMRHPPPRELKGTGERIRLTLSRFLVNLSLGLQAKKDHAQAFTDNLGSPFNYPQGIPNNL